jgi:hypothetical protein
LDIGSIVTPTGVKDAVRKIFDIAAVPVSQRKKSRNLIIFFVNPFSAHITESANIAETSTQFFKEKIYFCTDIVESANIAESEFLTNIFNKQLSAINACPVSNCKSNLL